MWFIAMTLSRLTRSLISFFLNEAWLVTAESALLGRYSTLGRTARFIPSKSYSEEKQLKKKIRSMVEECSVSIMPLGSTLPVPYGVWVADVVEFLGTEIVPKVIQSYLSYCWVVEFLC